MPLVSMKLTAADREAASPSLATAPDPPAYPYGLCLELDNDALEKLSLDRLPRVGATVLVTARAEVTRVSVMEVAGEGAAPRRALALQITDLALAPDEAETAEVLYGEARG
jgi:hypothetical protein